MARFEVGLLACDRVPPHLHGVAGDYPDMFRALFAEHAPGVDLVGYDVAAGQVPADPLQRAAWVVSGSRFSVYDDEPWIADVLDFVKAAHGAQVPLVGVCFGHQAVARALGGEVVRAEQGWGVGVHEAEVVARRDWMEPPAETLRLIMSHQDQVVRMPEEATVLARSEHCPAWMIAVGETTLGLQGHPEFAAPYAAALLETRTDRIPPPVATAARRSFSRRTDAGVVAGWLARFLTGGA
jgi:GMP synthase-like glutamine amidotransferase